MCFLNAVAILRQLIALFLEDCCGNGIVPYTAVHNPKSVVGFLCKNVGCIMYRVILVA